MPSVSTLAALKSSAAEHAKRLGLPTRRLENWHYTDLQRLLPITSVTSPAGEVDLPNLFETLKPLQFLFVDGVMQSDMPALSQTLSEAGLSISLLAGQKNISSLEGFSNDGLLAANVAHFKDGLKLSVSKTLQRPLEFVWACSAKDKAAYGRVVLHVKKGVQLTVLESHHGTGLSHVVNDIILDEGATLSIIKTHLADEEQAGISHTRCGLSAHAKLQIICVALQAGLARHENEISFNGSGAHAEIASAVLGQGTQHMDMTSCLDHRVAQTTSETIARTVLDDKACGVFQGKVIVRKDAQKVDANQKSNALMLSRSAQMNAKPELEIYADDVLCAHGSAIGEIDRDAVFFLRARGLTENEACHLLIESFLAEITERVSDAGIKNILNSHIASQLAGLGKKL